MKYYVGDGSELRRVELAPAGDGWVFGLEGRAGRADVRQVTGDCLSILVDGVSYKVHFLRQDGRTIVCVRGEYYDLEVLDEREKSMRESDHGKPRDETAGASKVRSRIPGKVVAVLVQPGSRVAAGEKLLVLEAMKMENEIRAAAPGVVKRLLVSAGDTVETNALLVEFES
ncbi:MAG: biotin/lipoyl-binding protein [Candidatus Wallbacteria bacterium]|nr:biotin/lipoyl-binding protein [Candidatus Wallbacteria bacterium]